LIDVTETNIGKWYDPISQRWIVPRVAAPAMTAPQSSADNLLELDRKGQVERIWHLLVDCCARG
jgi:hypothetical protein